MLGSKSQMTAFFVGVAALSGCSSKPKEPPAPVVSYVADDLPTVLPNHEAQNISEEERAAMHKAFDEAISFLTGRKAPEPEPEQPEAPFPATR